MKLLNFAIDSSIEVSSDGLIWDLHNCGNFEGLDLLVDQNSVLMKWTAAYPWSGHGNNFSRDDELPLTEDTCVAELFQVTPEGRDKHPRLRSLYEWTSDFHLFFRFQGGRTIEIGSRTVQLIPVL